MLRLSDIMSRDVVTFDQNLSMRDAMNSLASHHMSGAPVVSGNNVVGVISATDLLEFASSLPSLNEEREERDLESSGDDTAGFDDDGNFHSFFLDSSDEAGADSASRHFATDGLEWNVLEEHTVSESMTRVPICSLPSNAPVTEAAEYMQRASVHRILVIDAGKVVGIVTTTDIARAAAEGKLERRVYVFPSRGDSRR